MGRQTKLAQTISYTDEEQREQEITVAEAITRAVRIGVPLKFAAEAAGASESALMEWLAKGRQLIASNEEDQRELSSLTDNERLYVALTEDIKKAQASWVAWDLANIRRHARQTWQASAWRLERRLPGFFGLRNRADASDADEEMLAELDRMSDDDLDRELTGVDNVHAIAEGAEKKSKRRTKGARSEG